MMSNYDRWLTTNRAEEAYDRAEAEALNRLAARGVVDPTDDQVFAEVEAVQQDEADAEEAFYEEHGLPTDDYPDYEPPTVVLEDGVSATVGDRVFNYYDMRVATIVRIADDGWCDTAEGDLVNGPRMCSTAFAQSKGWL